MTKHTKEELFKMDAIEVYKMVLKGDKIRTFPNGFWKQEDGKQNACKCIVYLVEEILKYDEQTLKLKNNTYLFSKNKLSGMLNTFFHGSAYEAINTAYPGKYKEWEFKSTPQGYWTKENGIKATKWLIEEKLKLNDERLKSELSKDLFSDNGLSGMLHHCFNNSPYEAINLAYPNKYKEWEFKTVPQGYWTKENGIKATKWLLEDKLKLSDEEIKKKLCVDIFISNGLRGMLNICFNGSPYEAINNVYPGKYKEWEFENVPLCFWQKKENRIDAIKWLVEDKLKLNDDELKEQLSTKLFDECGLRGMLNLNFNDSPFEAINTAYPNKFKKSDFYNYSNKCSVNYIYKIIKILD